MVRALDAIDTAREYMPADFLRNVVNWIFEQGLAALHYDPISDQWHMSDGETYTTQLILREARK